MFVERQIYDEFVEKFVQRTKALKIGNPMAEDSKVGAMINTQHGHKVLTFINEAVQQVNINILFVQQIWGPKFKRF